MFTSLLLSAAAAYGIAVQAQPSCSDTHIYGRYHFSSNTVCISTNHADTAELREITLAHELVHAAQDCAGGGLHTARFTLAYSPDGGVPSSAAIESEATFLENNPQQVIELLHSHCP